MAPPGKFCGEIDAAGPCDLPNQCDGAGVCVDIKNPSGTICDYSHGACSPDSVCDGLTSACPANQALAGTPCGALLQGVCDNEGLCRDQNQELVTDNCPTGTGSDPDNDLDTYSTACDCDDNDPAVYLGTPCAGQSEECVSNICSLSENNVSACMPVNLPDGTACTNDTSSDACADGGFCSSSECVATISPAGTVCRASAGSCDITEYCDGSSTSCPSNALEPAGTACGNMENNSCVENQTCSGQSVSCDSALVYLDGVEAASSCSSNTPDSVCSTGLEYCVNNDLTNETDNPKTILVGNESQLNEEFGASVSGLW